MENFNLYKTINSLPEDLKEEVKLFIENLIYKKNQKSKKTREFGAFKGKIRMANDFDDELNEFSEYS